MNSKEADLGETSELKSKILEVLDGEILSTRQIAEKLGIVDINRDFTRVSEAIDEFFEINGEELPNPWLGRAISLGDSYSDYLRYYRVDQEDSHIEEGRLSRSTREVTSRPLVKEKAEEHMRDLRREKLLRLNLPKKILSKLDEYIRKEEDLNWK